jgi:hypothetical protein
VIAALEIEGADRDQHAARVVAHKIGRLDPPSPAGRIGGSCPQCARIKKGSAPTRTAHHKSQIANSQASRSIGAPRPNDQNLRLPQYPLTEAVANHLVRPSMGKVSRTNTVAPAFTGRPRAPAASLRARSAESCGMPAVTRAQKITFGERRSPDLLRGLSLQSFVRDQRQSMAR